jgi:hypothetical protein
MNDELVLLVGTTKGAFSLHSDARRERWDVRGPHLAGWEVDSLLGARHGRRIFAGTSHFIYGTTIRVSDDMGESWTQIEAGPQYSAESGHTLNRIWQLAHGHESEPDTIYAGVDEAGLFVSRDGGARWQEVSGLTAHPSRPHWQPGGGGLCLHTILPHPEDPQRMLVGISAVGVFGTTDGGANWVSHSAGIPQILTDDPDPTIGRCVHKMVRAPHDAETLYMQYHGGVFRSEDGGQRWSAADAGLPGTFGFPMVITAAGDLFIVPLEADTHRYAQDGRLRVYRSRDGGGSWTPCDNGLPAEPTYVGVLRDAMAVDPFDPAGVYIGTTMGDLFCSPDAGEHWVRLPARLPRITTVRAWVPQP